MNNSSLLKRFAIGTVFLLISLFVADFVLFEVLFKQYDKLNNLSRIKKQTDILFIGSSNILWGVDPAIISLNTKLRTNMIVVAGGDIEFRYHVAKEYVNRHKQNPPKLVVFHTDRHVFSKDRYSPLFYQPLQGYYHKGILKDYLSMRWQTPKENMLNKVFRCYTLNSQFSFIGSKIYDRFASPVNQVRSSIGNLNLVLFSELLAEPKPVQVAEKNIINKNFKFSELNQHQSDAQKVAAWKKKYQELAKNVNINESNKILFNQSADLFESAKIQVVFLETPVYKLLDGKDPYQKVRQIIQSRNSNYVHYLRVQPDKIETDISLYFDASHMNFKGKLQYSQALATELGQFLFLK